MAQQGQDVLEVARPGEVQPATAFLDRRDKSNGHWLVAVGPPALLVILGYLLHGLVGSVYRSFYTQLGTTPAEAGYDQASSMRTLAAIIGLTVGLSATVFLPAVAAFLATSGRRDARDSSRAILVSCLIPAAACLLALAGWVENPTVQPILAMAATFCSLGCMMGFIVGGIASPAAFLPPATLVATAMIAAGLRNLSDGVAFSVAAASLVIIIAAAWRCLSRMNLEQKQRIDGLMPRWPRALRYRLSIAITVIGVLAR